MIRGVLVAVALLAGCKGSDEEPPPRMQPPPVTAPPIDAAPPAGPSIEIQRCAAALPAPSVPVKTGGPRVTLGTAKVAGPVAKAAVAATLKKHANRLAYCYEQRLVRDPTVGGTSLLTIRIKPEGWVFEAHVEKSFDEELSLCVKHIVSELQFPAAAKGKTDETRVEQPLTFRWLGGIPGPVIEANAWTPFAASRTLAKPTTADAVALGIRKVLPLAKLEGCFGAHTGSLRSIMRVDAKGSVTAARSGGLGDAKAEACVSAALVGLAAEPPADAASEIVCDFTRGTPAPWRVDPAAGYAVIDAAKPVAYEPAPDDAERTFLVLADPDTPARAIETAMSEAARGAATLVAVRYDAGAPLLVAMRPRAMPTDPTAPFTLDTSEPRVCGGMLDASHAGSFDQADKLLATAASRCTHKPCPATLTITLDAKRHARELAGLAGAARGAGFERIALAAGSCPKSQP